MVGEAPVGSTATLGVLRRGQTIKVQATLDELKDTTGDAPSTAPSSDDTAPVAPSALGLRLKELNPDLSKQYGTKEIHGLVVVGVEDNSAAAAAGIEPGDIIEMVGQSPVTTVEEFQAAVKGILGRQTSDQQVALYINRKGDGSFVIVDANPGN